MEFLGTYVGNFGVPHIGVTFHNFGLFFLIFKGNIFISKSFGVDGGCWWSKCRGGYWGCFDIWLVKKYRLGFEQSVVVSKRSCFLLLPDISGTIRDIFMHRTSKYSGMSREYFPTRFVEICPVVSAEFPPERREASPESPTFTQPPLRVYST